MMWELIRKNQRKSLDLFLLMGIILLVLGFSIGAIFEAGEFGLFLALFIWATLSLISYYQGDSILLAASGASEIEHALHPQLFNVVEEMSIAAGFSSIPRIYVVTSFELNAYAVGRNPEKCAIVVTSGLLEQLNRDELQGVIAHEISHIFNRDTLFMTFAGVMLGSIQLVSETFFRSWRFGGELGRFKSKSKSSSANGYILLITIVIAILGPILAQVLYFAISRKREYLADASAVRLTRYPEGLASALEKISQGPFSKNVSRIMAPLYITNPLGNDQTGLFGGTHPPIQERIRILRGISQGADFRNYQIAFSRMTMTDKPIIPKVALSRTENILLRGASTEVETFKNPIHHGAGDFMRAVNRFTFLSCKCGLKYKIPPDSKISLLTCPRCGEVLNAPAIKQTNAQTSPQQTPQVYIRTGTGWESVHCACGRMIQLSPLFGAPRVVCPECKSTIEVKAG